MKSFQKKGQVSIWVGLNKCDPTVDILKDLCGVASYDVDSQECIVDVEEWTSQPVEELLKALSYSESFFADARNAAQTLKIRDALYVLAQYDFAYDPKKVRKSVAPDPIFLGSFPWSDE